MDLWTIRKTYQTSYTVVSGSGYSQKVSIVDGEYFPFNYGEEQAGKT